MNKLFAHLFFVVTGCFSAANVYAAVTGTVDLIGLPWAQIAVGTLLSLWGGMTRTSERALEASKAQTEFRLAAELGKDVLVSAGLGFLIYVWGNSQQISVGYLGAALWLGGYAGTRLLVGLVNAALSYVERKGDKL